MKVIAIVIVLIIIIISVSIGLYFYSTSNGNGSTTNSNGSTTNSNGSTTNGNGSTTNSNGSTTEPEICVVSPNYSHYKFCHAMNSSRNNMRKIDINVNDVDVKPLIQECDNDQECVGFNTKGWLKHTINDELVRNNNWADQPQKGLYIKR